MVKFNILVVSKTIIINLDRQTTKNYWTKRYEMEETGWDIGKVSRPLKTYFDQLEDKAIKILIPGAGNAYEAGYLLNKGFNNVYVLDISEKPLLEFKKRYPDFPKTQLLCEDFFAHEGSYDLIIEQTFFCSFPPLKSSRHTYANRMCHLLKDSGKLVGLWFDIPLTDDVQKHPFGGDSTLYLYYLTAYFRPKVFEKCYNSIPERANNELFGIFIKI